MQLIEGPLHKPPDIELIQKETISLVILMPKCLPNLLEKNMCWPNQLNHYHANAEQW